MVRPYDPTQVLRKIHSLKHEGVDTSKSVECCPTSSEVRDAKDFKPYLMAALDEFSDIMGMNVNKRRRYND